VLAVLLNRRSRFATSLRIFSFVEFYFFIRREICNVDQCLLSQATQSSFIFARTLGHGNVGRLELLASKLGSEFTG
jgi:hypothetical protein